MLVRRFISKKCIIGVMELALSSRTDSIPPLDFGTQSTLSFFENAHGMELLIELERLLSVLFGEIFTRPCCVTDIFLKTLVCSEDGKVTIDDFCLPVNNRQNVPSVTTTNLTHFCPCYIEEEECLFH